MFASVRSKSMVLTSAGPPSPPPARAAGPPPSPLLPHLPLTPRQFGAGWGQVVGTKAGGRRGRLSAGGGGADALPFGLQGRGAQGATPRPGQRGPRAARRR